MWTDLSSENIMPGLKICDECAASIDSGAGAADKLKGLVNSLDKWATNAANNVAQIAGNVSYPQLTH